MRQSGIVKFLARLLLGFYLFNFANPIIGAQVFIPATTDVSMDLRLVPTSLVVTPSSASVHEATISFTPAPVQFTATAYYNYAGQNIAPRNVTNDALTAWYSSNTSVAIVNTVGLVTAVSDLNTGSAHSTISATYGGITGNATMTVTGDLPSSGGGGGGGGGSVPVYDGGSSEPSTDSGSPSTGTEEPAIPDTGNDAEHPIGDEFPVIEPTNNNSEEPSNTPGEETSPEGVNETPTGETNPGSGELPGTVFNQPPVENPYLPLVEPYVDGEIRPVAEVFEPSEYTKVEGQKTGVSRAFVAARIADRLKILELRRDLLKKCYNDLNNCTNIFRMFSSYQGINLDPNNLRLFPDVDGLPEEKRINELALLSIVQGYYGIENSPFLPEKAITRAEMSKVLISIIANLEKSKTDYQPDQFDYSSLFYKEIYATSLLMKARQQKSILETVTPKPLTSAIKMAHALSEEGLALIKAQKTVFFDVRPDLYDAHWYYPIVFNKICEEKIYVCHEGSLIKPDESPSVDDMERLLTSFANFIKEKGLDVSVNSDDDNDQILNIDENLIYLTDPSLADTDQDQLNDGEEVKIYNTDPNSVDTDNDQLTDGEEVNKYKTDPNLYDTDDDSFSDSIEIKAGSDPLSKSSIPVDKNSNEIADDWELKYGLEVPDGSQDSDGDGISDILEYKYNTNPKQIDSDMDGFTDAEEILDMLSDPNDPNDPGDLSSLPVVINNLQFGQLISDPSPMIKGVGPATLGENLVRVQILLRNEFGSEMMLGETLTDVTGRFVFVPDIEIKNGTYFIIARAISNDEVKSSKPLKIIIDSSLEVASAKPEKLENTPITDEVIIKKLVLKIDSTDGKPVLLGTVSEFGSRVNVTWQSLVVSSALIADATDGSFKVKAPELGPGRHTVYVQTVRKRDNAMGRTIKINFELDVTGEAENISKGAGGVVETVSNLVGFVAKQSWSFWIGFLVILAVAGGGVYIFKNDKGDKKNKGTKT